MASPVAEEFTLLAAVAIPATVAMGWLLTGRIRRWLIAKEVLDRPNARSSHDTPVPRGGGLAVMLAALPVALAGGIVVGAPAVPLAALLLGTAILAVIGMIDDVKTLAVGPRFLVQIACSLAVVLILFMEMTPPFGRVWIIFMVSAALIGLLWFVNLYNFMDGIDGITAVETVSICFGLVVVDLLSRDVGSAWIWSLAAPIAAATIGFAIWNWAPAKIFMGDAGSVALGLLVGGLLLALALRGQILPALILPAYYLADASLTMARRLLQGHKPWEAHRDHFYQRAVRRGSGHASVSLRIAGLNLVLIVCALASLKGYPVWGTAVAAVCVAAVLVSFNRGTR